MSINNSILLMMGRSEDESIIGSTDPFGDGSLIAKYQFEGDVTDTLGAYDATSGGITYESAKFGQGVVHDEDTSYVDSSAVGIKTISLFAKHTNLNSNMYIIDPRLISGTGYCYIQDTSGGGDINFVDCTVKINGVEATSTVTVPDLSVWNHYVITLDAVTTGVTIGGQNARQVNSSWNGTIDQAELYDRILTTDEIARLEVQI